MVLSALIVNCLSIVECLQLKEGEIFLAHLGPQPGGAANRGVQDTLSLCINIITLNNWIVWNKFFEGTRGKDRQGLRGNPILTPIYPSLRVRVNQLFTVKHQ